MEYVYKATDPSGRILEGAMEGRDEKAVVESLQKLGYIPIRISAAEGKGVLWSRVASYFERVTLRDLLIFTQELSTLLDAGLSLDRSLQILADVAEKERFREIIRDVLRKIEAGSSLSEALSSYPSIFPRLYVNMVRAGETGGVLNIVLTRLARYLQGSKDIRDNLISVLIYPALLTFVSGLCVTILLIFVIPRFTQIFSDMGQSLPLPTQILLSVSHFIRDYWWGLAGAVLLTWFLLRGYIHEGDGKVQWDRFKLRLAIVGQLVRELEIARFSRTMGTLIQSGVPILQALQIVRETAGNEIIARAIGEVHAAVKQGAGISRALQNSSVFPPLSVHMITVGEETGKLEEMLIRVAETYEASLQTALRRFMSLLEPMIIVLMASVVGFIVFSVLMAILSINEIPF